MLDAIPAAPADDFHAPSSPPPTIRHRPEFSGRAGEYFGIWFVNLLLSIVTLGIYSAWAKVRTERYFYGNTRLAGASFDYLASPIAILKGRLIAYAIVIAMVVSSRFSPGFYLLLLLGVGLMLPALIVFGLRFRARNSAWRGVSFRFDGGAAEAYGPFMLWGFLSSITMTLLYPMMMLRQHEFVIEGHRYGVQRFAFKGEPGAYYVPYAIAAAISVAAFVAFMVLMGVFGVASAGGQPGSAIAIGMAVGALVLYVAIFVASIFMRVRYANLFWNNARLGAHRFESTLRVRDMLWIYFSNAVVIVCTIGLGVPWAMVRLARYRSGHFSLLAAGSLDDFVAASEARPGAFGAEMVDALDVGVELGI